MNDSKPYDPITREELFEQMRDILENKLIPIAKAKGSDYTGSEGEFDCLANVGEELGWAGAFFRGRDKDRRLRTYLEGRAFEVSDESVEDAFIDRLNYCFYAYILWKRRRKDVFIVFNDRGDDE